MAKIRHATTFMRNYICHRHEFLARRQDSEVEVIQESIVRTLTERLNTILI